MKKSIFHITAMLAILAATPAFSTGFNGRDLARAAQEHAEAQNTQQTEILNATEVFRLQMAYNPTAAINSQNDAIKRAFVNVFGELSNKRAYQAAWFMAGAISKSGDNNSQTKLYNPLAQIWLVLDWSKSGDAWQLVAVNASRAQVADWTLATSPYLQALANSYFEALNGDNGVAAAGDTLFANADKWISGLADFVLNPNKQSAAQNTLEIIHEGRAARFGADGNVIDTLPATVRATFAPITGFRRNNGSSLLFGTPLFPQIIIAADFDGANRPNLKSLTLLNLANATGEMK
jgi:hypothetical protein